MRHSIACDNGHKSTTMAADSGYTLVVGTGVDMTIVDTATED